MNFSLPKSDFRNLFGFLEVDELYATVDNDL